MRRMTEEDDVFERLRTTRVEDLKRALHEWFNTDESRDTLAKTLSHPEVRDEVKSIIREIMDEKLARVGAWSVGSILSLAGALIVYAAIKLGFIHV